MNRIWVLPLCLALANCASIVSGSSQSLTVQTTPVGAVCEVNKNGVLVGAVNPTPSTIQVKRGLSSLDVKCQKEGYETVIQKVDNEFNPWYIGNLLFGGVVGLIVDPITGAWQKYPESTSVVLPQKPIPTVYTAPGSTIDKHADAVPSS